ncbi:hypothetical protein DO72_6141 [Burkholderia pseudomallei]|nr:hypothetical protein DO72_6141 [Burkholderia pseudomallei]
MYSAAARLSITSRRSSPRGAQAADAAAMVSAVVGGAAMALEAAAAVAAAISAVAGDVAAAAALAGSAAPVGRVSTPSLLTSPSTSTSTSTSRSRSRSRSVSAFESEPPTPDATSPPAAPPAFVSDSTSPANVTMFG